MRTRLVNWPLKKGGRHLARAHKVGGNAAGSEPVPLFQLGATRREFLATVTAFPVGLTSAEAFGAASDEDRTPVVDTHLHCFAGKDDDRFPYHARAPYRPDEAATPQHLLHCMDGAGVDYAVVVHPEPYQDDHRYLEYCLEVGRRAAEIGGRAPREQGKGQREENRLGASPPFSAGRLKGTCLVFADRPGSVEKLPGLVEKLDVVAARIHAYAPERLPPFGKPQLRRLWKLAGELGLAIQLHFEPRYAPGFEPLIKEFHDTAVIIDHLGRPLQGTPREHAVVVGWSRYKNTVMKLSSLPPKRSYPHRDIAPIIKQLAGAYGADRMIYGGGFNATANPESYRAYRERARTYLSHLSAADQAKVFGGTAARLFGFESRQG